MHYLLIYELAPDYLDRRGAFRNEHLKLAWQADGIVLGGALADPVDRAMLLFEGDSPASAERFAKADPYVKNGLVKRWEVRAWTTVVGKHAASPVRPS
ncbi:MAG TPA: YciI-like protein [Casimicrobiaceae bacterium]